MSVIAKQSTARTVMVGPILDADGVAVTTAAIGDLKLSKNGGIPAAFDGSATLTHRATGHYSLAATANDLDTVGQAEVVIDATTNAMPVKVITVIEEAIYDAMFAASATGLLPANVTQLGGDAQSATDLKDFADAGYDPVTNKVEGVKLADTTTANSDMRGTDSAALASVCTETRLAELDAANLPADLDAVLADTNELQTDLTNGGRLDLLIDQIITDIAALNDPTANAIADALLDRADGVETGFTLRQATRLILAAAAAKLSGAATTTVSIRDVGDTKNRIVATVDSDGNRSAVTLDAT